MKRRVFMVTAAVLLCVVGVLLLWVCFFPRQTTYQGQTVSAWMRQLLVYGEASKEAKAAFQAMGEKAVPDLIRLLRKTDGPLSAPLRGLAQGLPPAGRRAAFRLVLPYPAHESRIGAARALAVIGPGAVGATKALTLRMRDSDPGVAYEAARALTHVRADCGPELIAALGDKNPNARRAAALACAQLGARAGPVLPELILRLEDTDAQVRGAADGSISIIGAPAIPELLRFAASRAGDARKPAATIILGLYGAGSLPVRGNDFLVLPNDSPLLQKQRVPLALEMSAQKTDPIVLQLIAAMALDTCPEVRVAALEALRGVRTSLVLTTLNERLRDTSPEVRATAARIMSELVPRGKPG